MEILLFSEAPSASKGGQGWRFHLSTDPAQEIGVALAQPLHRTLEALLHRNILIRSHVSSKEAVLQGNTIGVLEVDGPGPFVVDDVRHFDTLADQFTSLVFQGRC